jgi:hypothetical protein
MGNYIHNLLLWWEGWQRFGELRFKPGWYAEGWAWRILYATDYLACPLFLAGPVVSLSRYWYEFWGVEGRHFMQAGPALWGSVRCSPWVRVVIPLAWMVGVWYGT